MTRKTREITIPKWEDRLRENSMHGARGSEEDRSHGGGWHSTDAEVVNSAIGVNFREGVFFGREGGRRKK